MLISRAKPNHPPHIDATLISAAAALAGVLGSAFALRVGNPASQTFTNQSLKDHLDAAAEATAKERTNLAPRVHRAIPGSKCG